MVRITHVVLAAVLFATGARVSNAQDRGDGAAALGEAVESVGVSARVLMIGAHPDDEDTRLIAWLARGRHVETAYLSLTRGDGGQNLIGNELGEGLGVIRTEELLAARRVDGGRQFFTRAYDFGYSKSADETYRHWPHDSLLGDVIGVVRAFRPHVIVSVFSGTVRDGHGHHQVAGMLATEAYELAADTLRFPERLHGKRWTPLKLYQSARSSAQTSTLRVDAGEYDPLIGRSFAEVAGESRSEHKSQGFGALERKGVQWAYLRRVATRVNEEMEAGAELSVFQGIDTTWARFRDAVREPGRRAALDSLPSAFAAVRTALDLYEPETVIGPLLNVSDLLERVCPIDSRSRCRDEMADAVPHDADFHAADADLLTSLQVAGRRVRRALSLATSIAIEATVSQPLAIEGTDTPVEVIVYNRGSDTLLVGPPFVSDAGERTASAPRLVPPAGVRVDTIAASADSVSMPWWLRHPRAEEGGMFAEFSSLPEDTREPPVEVTVPVEIRGRTIGFTAPVVYRYADPVRGDVSEPLSVVPAVSLTLDGTVQYVRAGAPVDRVLRVRVRSAANEERDVTVRVRPPDGLEVDSAHRTVRIGGSTPEQTTEFLLAGQLAPGRHIVRVSAEHDGVSYTRGYATIEYDHIRPQHVYRSSELALEAVDVVVPPEMTVAYIPGVGDEVAGSLLDLGVDVTVIEPGTLPGTDLSAYSAVVVGPRAYEASPELRANRARLLEYAHAGGTLVVQYQQYEVMQPGTAPYPLRVNRPHDRVTEEDSPVTLLLPAAGVLESPNRIEASDFDGWVQERALYMPAEFDRAYIAPLEMHDPGSQPNQGAILVAGAGRGTYVFTSISFFRQLPAGVPGAARLFVNLLSAGGGGVHGVAPTAREE